MRFHNGCRSSRPAPPRRQRRRRALPRPARVRFVGKHQRDRNQQHRLRTGHRTSEQIPFIRRHVIEPREPAAIADGIAGPRHQRPHSHSSPMICSVTAPDAGPASAAIRYTAPAALSVSEGIRRRSGTGALVTTPDNGDRNRQEADDDEVIAIPPRRTELDSRCKACCRRVPANQSNPLASAQRRHESCQIGAIRHAENNP